MKDQVQALNQAGIHAAYINSSLTETQISKALQLAAKGQYKIIYVAPERLETYNFMQFVTQVDISMLTVDEAHCISQWGQDFRPSYLKIVQFIKSLPKRPIVSAFTATATERVKEDIMCVLGLITPKVLVTGFDRENLYFGVETPLKKDEYVTNYINEHATDSGIIYCATRKNVDKLHEKLLSCGISVTKYHAGLTSTERQENQEAFIYDKSPVMVATNAFGMGIDKSNVRYVLHYNMPQSLENYYQEAGRAGRDGEASECILLYSAQDVVINRFLLDNKEPNPELDADENEAVRQRDEERLQSMINYCMTPNCLRKYILNYFGEYGKGDCGNCSSCLNEYEEWDITEITHKIIACIDELKGRYGINVVAGTLSGNDRAKLREYKVSTYTTYASLKELSEAQIKQVIQYLMIENIIDVTKDKYALLRTTTKAREILTQATPIIMKKPKTVTTTATTTKTTRSNRKSDILNSRGLELFETLRSLRTVIAKEESIPPYLVFSDKTLVDMCIKAPLNKEEMLNVSGVGNNKYDRYGERFINEINIFTNGRKEKMHFGEAHEAQTFTTRQQSEKVKKSDFYLTTEQAQNFPYADKYLVTEIAVHLSTLRDGTTVKKITGADIFRKMQVGDYATEQYIDGMRRKVVFEKGKSAGLFIAPRTSHKGTEYEDIYYNEAAQRMIVEMYIKC
jgi:ATP-dependent DNA helicase RecQ